MPVLLVTPDAGVSLLHQRQVFLMQGRIMWKIASIACSVAGLLLVTLVTDLPATQRWGNLQGQVIYNGDPPAPVALKITKDREECCQHNLVDESLVVHPLNHGLMNVLVFLYPNRGDQVVVHPGYESWEKAEKKLDNKACRFDPRVVLLWTKQTLLIGNSDPIGHNAMIDTRKNPPINVTVPSGGTVRKQFAVEEREPVPVSCSIHPWMRGWVLIRDNPYMAVTDENGHFEIQNVPAGKWTFVFWHEKTSFLTDVVVAGKAANWKRGRTEILIEPGANDLGVVTVKPDLFQ